MSLSWNAFERLYGVVLFLGLVLVVLRLDSPIHRYPVVSGNKTNNAIHWMVIYLVDSIIHLSNNWGLIFFRLLLSNCLN